MRPIKFRAWDKFEEEWIDDPIIDGQNGKMMGFSLLDGSFLRHYSDDQITLVQYKGLKDKNGTEIYEGDILRHFSIKKKELYQVKWDEHNASFHIIQGDGGFAMFTTSEGFFPYVVIGNIYKNPELLEDKK